MKNKGFTLIEMLIVIVLLGIILTLAIPSVIRIMENRSNDSYKYQMKLVEQAVNLYQARYRGEFNNNPNATCFLLDYKLLLDEELIEEQDIKCEGKIALTRPNATSNLSKSYFLKCVDQNNVKFSDYRVADIPSGCVDLGIDYEDNITNIEAPTIKGGNSDWVPTNIEISVENSGISLSEVKRYEYFTSTSSNKPTAYVSVTGTTDNKVIITEEGTTYIWYRVVDKNGNVSKWSNRQVANIDRTQPDAPTITAFDGISSGGKHESEFTLMFGGGNNISGNSYYYGTTNNPTEMATSINVTADMNGQTIYVKSCNGANICSSTSSYLINIEVPQPPTEPINQGGE